jgi:hypothetical protein
VIPVDVNHDHSDAFALQFLGNLTTHSSIAAQHEMVGDTLHTRLHSPRLQVATEVALENVAQERAKGIEKRADADQD